MYAAHLMISTPLHHDVRQVAPTIMDFRCLENNVSLTFLSLRVPRVIFYFWHGISLFRTQWFTNYYSPNAQNFHRDMTTLLNMGSRDQGFEFICLVLENIALISVWILKSSISIILKKSFLSPPKVQHDCLNISS